MYGKGEGHPKTRTPETAILLAVLKTIRFGAPQGVVGSSLNPRRQPACQLRQVWKGIVDTCNVLRNPYQMRYR